MNPDLVRRALSRGHGGFDVWSFERKMRRNSNEMTERYTYSFFDGAELFELLAKSGFFGVPG